jgi:hypothetical protein
LKVFLYNKKESFPLGQNDAIDKPSCRHRGGMMFMAYEKMKKKKDEKI